jgi:hypothetical protein
MPIGQGGMLASRACTWPRDHFWHDGAARIVAHDVERVLADIDADHGHRGIGYLRHGVLLVFGVPNQLRLLAGQEHGRTIPLADIPASMIVVSSDSMARRDSVPAILASVKIRRLRRVERAAY